MTVKRLRVTRSSSNLLAESSTAPESSRSCRDALPRGKAMRVSQPENKAILQVSPPSPGTEENASGEKKKEKFFEKCYNCEKKIGEADAVFMYSYLLAFCCEDCRDDQIEQDRTFESSP
ncbi:hypothetical protein QQ045_023434 [Rhodiola kirilowii]